MNEATDAGFVFGGVMGGETSVGGKEVVVIMVKDPFKPQGERRIYKLLATSKSSTMQRELREAGETGFRIVGVTVAKTAFGGAELVSIMRK